MSLQQLSANLFLFRDTCNVYLLRSGEEAVLVDFGSGEVLDHLGELGVTRVTDVLMTHHHRDQAQGLPRAVAEGVRIWAPHVEQELFAGVDAHWQARELVLNYNMREDRFSLLEPVPLSGTLHDYATYQFGGYQIEIEPTPGHTVGSITLLTKVDGRRVAFTGDLIAAPGKVWSLAATQWSYNGAEGVAASVASLLALNERAPDVLLPSHGEPMYEPEAAMQPLIERMWELLRARAQNPRLFELHDHPYAPITKHLLFNRTSLSNSYVLLSESGKALFIDYGYDFMTGAASGSDRAARRPWLYTLPELKKQFGVTKVDVVLPTHYHDDHVAGFNLLRDVEGTEVWAPTSFANILEHPNRYDLPCLWHDAIPVDRVVPIGEPFKWEEYEFILHEQAGHTRFAIAIEFMVDGQKVVAVGDQYEGGKRWNYVYRNRFDAKDYQRSAALYQRLQPDLILFGHFQPVWVKQEEGYLEELAQQGDLLDRLHNDLLFTSSGTTVDGATVRIEPYQSVVCGGETQVLAIEVMNPSDEEQEAVIRLVAPRGWMVTPQEVHLFPRAHEAAVTRIELTPPAGIQARRARVAADVTVGGHRFGQQAEALVTVIS